MIQSFTENKPSKRSRGGLLPMVRIYERFSQLANSAFADSGRISDLERAHGELVRSLMTEIERVASESVKTPREVVQMGKLSI
ncbi:unnamed protein product [Protopolystoma xenopodis]|uniref:Uncharacterized protein n=1 Tax=Protopolystoma xenopodis TaxID=117903 RepID=A0A448X166_9PLAT|nr:unnamed protein product [Protopolystoma xenopodis]